MGKEPPEDGFEPFQAKYGKSQDIGFELRKTDPRLGQIDEAQADVSRWARKPLWNLDEAVALSFGKPPELIQWDWLQYESGPFAHYYAERRRIVAQAQDSKELPQTKFVRPEVFIDWCERRSVAFPAELAREVQRYQTELEDWRQKYDELQNKYETLSREKQQLQYQLDAARTAYPAPQRKRDEQELNPKVRTSFRKMVLGMAMAKYGYHPNAGRNDATARIATDLETRGLSLDQNTIRDRLDEAKEVLPASR